MYAVVPLKAFAHGKQRLAPLLSPAERAGLSRAMAKDVLGKLQACRHFDRLLLCASGEDMPPLAEEFNAELVDDAALGGDDLNALMAQLGVRLRRRGVDRLLVVHSDLPLLQTQDLMALTEALTQHQVVIAPDRHRAGSNCLGWQLGSGFTPSFGVDSFQRHRRQALALGCSQWHYHGGCRWDVDRAEDIAAVVEAANTMTLGEHSRDFLNHSGMLQRLLASAPLFPSTRQLPIHV